MRIQLPSPQSPQIPGNTYVAAAAKLPVLDLRKFLHQRASSRLRHQLDPNGDVLFTDTFAGQGLDVGTAIALDPSGNIYIAGTTTSPHFPMSRSANADLPRQCDEWSGDRKRVYYEAQQ